MHLLECGGWLKDRLVVFDLGFFKAELFKELDGAGGYFLCRLKKQSNPWIIGNYDEVVAHLIGKRLKKAQSEISRPIIDIEGKMTCQVGPNKNRKFSVPFRARVSKLARLGYHYRQHRLSPPDRAPAN